MRIAILALAAGGVLSLAVALNRTHEASAAGPPAKVLRHVVLYKFRDDMKPEQVQQVVDAFGAMVKQIDTVIGFEHGVNVSQEGKSDGLTHGFVVTFRDEKGRDAYIAHPAHADYVKIAKDRREKVVVFDYWGGD